MPTCRANAELRYPQLACEVFSRPRRRFGAAVPWQLRFPRGWPERHGRCGRARQHAATKICAATRGCAKPTAATCQTRPGGSPRVIWTHKCNGRREPERGGESGLRTGRRIEDRPGGHRQPAGAHAGCGATGQTRCANASPGAQAVRARSGDRRFRRAALAAGPGYRACAAGWPCMRQGCCRWRWPTAPGDIEALAEQLGLPLLAKFRAQYERMETGRTGAGRRAPARSRGGARQAGRQGRQHFQAPDACPATRPLRATALRGKFRPDRAPARSAPGAEVIADGSIHIYGTLRGRALAGAQGDTSTRIFCRDFQAELVAIAGITKCWTTSRRTCAASPCSMAGTGPDQTRRLRLKRPLIRTYREKSIG